MTTDRFHLYEKGHKKCTPIKVLTIHRTVDIKQQKEILCAPCCLLCGCIVFIFMFIFNMVFGILFRIVDVPLAIINVLLCYQKTGFRCDIFPAAGESYLRYLVCCLFSLVVNALVPADLDALFDCDGLSTCCEFVQALAECEESEGSQKKHEVEKVSQYYDKYIVVEDKNPIGPYYFCIWIFMCCLALFCDGSAPEYDSGGSDKPCCQMHIDEEALFELSENKKFEDGTAMEMTELPV